MPYTPDQILKAIEQLYEQLDENFDDIYAKCASDDQRKTLRSLFVAARDAYFKAVKETLCDNNATVENITDDLVDTNKTIGTQVQDLKDIVAFIELCSNAVQLAASLATLAAAA